MPAKLLHSISRHSQQRMYFCAHDAAMRQRRKEAKLFLERLRLIIEGDHLNFEASPTLDQVTRAYLADSKRQRQTPANPRPHVK